VFKNTPSMTYIALKDTTCYGKDNIRSLSFVDHLESAEVICANFLPGDISVLANCKSLTSLGALGCNGVTG